MNICWISKNLFSVLQQHPVLFLFWGGVASLPTSIPHHNQDSSDYDDDDDDDAVNGENYDNCIY